MLLAVAVVTLAVAVVAALFWGLIAALRGERQRQAPSKQTPLWQLFVVAALAYAVISVLAQSFGWTSLNVPARLALLGVLVVSFATSRKLFVRTDRPSR